MSIANLIVIGGYRCPYCGGKRWKIEDNTVYCIAKKENGNPCCWHLTDDQSIHFKAEITKRKNKLCVQN